MIGAWPKRISRLNLSRAEDFQVATRERTPLPHRIDDRRRRFGGAAARPSRGKHAQRLDHVTTIGFGRLKLPLPIFSDLFRDLLSLQLRACFCDFVALAGSGGIAAVC